MKKQNKVFNFYVAVDDYGTEWLFYDKPIRSKSYNGEWICSQSIRLQEGTIYKLLNRKLYWRDEPIQVKLLKYV